MISVIIPLYNKAQHIRQTVESVLGQSFINYELIIVDDGSTDSGLEQIADLLDHRIKIIKQKNNGVSAARNTGLNNASFDIIALLDADDIWLPNHLETLAKMSDAYPQMQLYSTAYYCKLDNNLEGSKNPLGITCDKRGFTIIENIFHHLSEGDNFLWTSVLAFNRKNLPSPVFYNENMRMGEDLDFLLRNCTDEKSCYSLERTAIYNLDAENRACKKYVMSDINNPMLNEWFFQFSGRTTEKEKFAQKCQYSFVRNLISFGYGKYLRMRIIEKGWNSFGIMKNIYLLFLSFVPNGLFLLYRKLK